MIHEPATPLAHFSFTPVGIADGEVFIHDFFYDQSGRSQSFSISRASGVLFGSMEQRVFHSARESGFVSDSPLLKKSGPLDQLLLFNFQDEGVST